MIKHKINDNAGDRNIEPDRIGKSDDSFMTRKLPGHGVKHRPQNKRQNDERKPDMRDLEVKK